MILSILATSRAFSFVIFAASSLLSLSALPLPLFFLNLSSSREPAVPEEPESFRIRSLWRDWTVLIAFALITQFGSESSPTLPRSAIGLGRGEGRGEEKGGEGRGGGKRVGQ